jgi:large repetitive protein
MSNRRAQDERIEGTPDGSNAISEIVDIPDAPTIGSATAGMVSASVAFTPSTTGGTVSTYTATSTPGSITGTSATSPITVSGLTAGTSYTFKVKGTNSTGTGAESSASNSITALAPMEGAYDALATAIVPSGGLSSIIFSGIPSGYKNLQLRINGQSNRGTFGIDQLRMQVGSGSIDSGSTSYAWHYIRGENTSLSTLGYATSSGDNGSWQLNGAIGTTTGSNFGAIIIDIVDYSSTSKNKTMRSLSGTEHNTAIGTVFGRTAIGSCVWLGANRLSPITIINLFPENGTLFTQHSSFALYGVK